MSELVLVTGGARSGKSTFAEKLCKKKSKNIVYIATAIPFDSEMKDRIEKHKEARPKDWMLIEKYKDFDDIEKIEEFNKAKVILLDCITVMISNIFFDKNIDSDTTLEEYNELEGLIIKEIDSLIDIIYKNNKDAIFVTNELGMGIVPSNRFTRIYRDIAGRVNQHIASRADKVYLTVAGIGINIKAIEEKTN